MLRVRVLDEARREYAEAVKWCREKTSTLLATWSPRTSREYAELASYHRPARARAD